MKQREHKTIDIDFYPQLDGKKYCNIKYAVAVADAKYPDAGGREVSDANIAWSLVFHDTMNKMLKKEGLRQ